MSRREFTKVVKVQIIKRATKGGRVIYCEAPDCGQPCRRFEIHHLKMDAMEVDKSRKLTANDGLLLCEPCHDRETKAQAPILAKARAREAAYLGVKPSPARPIHSAGFAKSPKSIARKAREPKTQLPPKAMFE